MLTYRVCELTGLWNIWKKLNAKHFQVDTSCYKYSGNSNQFYKNWLVYFIGGSTSSHRQVLQKTCLTTSLAKNYLCFSLHLLWPMTVSDTCLPTLLRYWDINRKKHKWILYLLGTIILKMNVRLKSSYCLWIEPNKILCNLYLNI